MEVNEDFPTQRQCYLQSLHEKNRSYDRLWTLQFRHGVPTSDPADQPANAQTLNEHLKMTEQMVFDVYNAEGKRLNQSGLTQEEVFNFVQQLQESKVDAKFSIRSRPAR
jgi:hypothetical protein